MPQAQVRKRLFDVEEYHRMGEVGLLGKDDRVELIRGEIVDMNPIRSRHLACVTNLTHMLVERANGRYFVSVQSSIRLGDDSEPEPEFALLRERPKQSDEEIPSADGVFLVIEVSDTTLDYDRDVKLPLYAESGVPEVWIVDLNGGKVEVHSEPAADGYRSIKIFGAGEEVRSATLENLSVSVDEALS